MQMKWRQLLLGVVCLAVASNLQYGWTLFVGPMQAKHAWSLSGIQWAFAIFIAVQSWLTPFEGYSVDLLGPRLSMAAAGALIALGWVTSAFANDLSVLYVGAVLGGIGSGFALSTGYGSILKWFALRRGLAVGLTSAGYGGGAALTVWLTSEMIRTAGYESAFLILGLGQGVIVMVLALFMRAPHPNEVEIEIPKQRVARAYTPREAMSTPVFYVMYATFVLVAFGGLMASAQLGPVAKDFGVSGVPVSFAWITMPALTFALTFDRLTNGLSRPLFGWISDRIGREWTMFIAFAGEGVGIYALVHFAHDPILFVLFSGLVFFAWGEIFSIFPSLCTDIYGRKFAATNYGLLYTAKGVAALFVPYGSVLAHATGSWHSVFYIAAALDIAAAVVAVAVLLPMRRRMMRSA